MITEFEQVNFMKNWNNKLSCDSFTTFRLHNPRKYAIGRCLSIMLNRRRLKDANVVKIKTMKLNQVNEFVARLEYEENRGQNEPFSDVKFGLSLVETPLGLSYQISAVMI